MSAQSPPSQVPSKQPRILVTDDSAAFRLMARDTLEQLGCVVLEAGSSADAIASVERHHPDLVILDVHLPDRDGFEACEEIRRVASPHMPIAMVTARDHVDSIHRAYEAGATDFLTKPVNWLLLTHRVQYMLRMHDVLRDFQRSQDQLASAQRIARLGSWQLSIGDDHFACSDELRRLYGLENVTDALSLDGMLEQVPPDDRALLRDAARRAVDEQSTFALDHRVIPSPGLERIVHTQGEVSLDDDGEPVALVGTTQDITDRKRAQAQIRMLAYHDSLTRLANRRLFRERLKQALAQASRHRNVMAILAIDLDHFKRINDTFGHSVGDSVLQQVAARLSHCVRDSDCVSRARGGESVTTVSRLGGDEFMLLLPDVADAQDATKVASRVLQVLSRPFLIRDHELVIGGSIGITISPYDGKDVDTLLRNADAAMYHAKGAGRNVYKFYERSMNEEARKRLKLEAELRRALDRKELSVNYQPKIELSSGKVVGFEALVRWQHADLGFISPADFIPVAEQGGLILQLGEFVLETACQQMAEWSQDGFRDARVAVNLSPHQFKGDDLVPTVARVLSRSGLSPRNLDLEITESALMENEEVAIGMLEKLKRLGITVSLDDFGTGYSSLSYLRRFPVDTVKIDRSFVKEIGSDRDGEALASTIITMGKCLHLKVVAEGVETEEQLSFLREHGCDEMQGYLVSAPVPADRAVEFLRNGRVWD